jgi:hypothetical protein
MTSTEFAARYRLLKNVATRGARSFLAQQIELGRMVMVHYLDSETPEQRSATLARLQSLQPPARQKLLEIADVDGSPVAVTLFISSFVDFTTWLDSVSAAVPVPPPVPVTPPVAVTLPAKAPTPEAAAGDFTLAFQKAASSPFSVPRTPAPAAKSERKQQEPAAPPPRSAGEFTQLFGKIEGPSGATNSGSFGPAGDAEESTQIIEPARPPAARPEEPPPAPESGGFTAIFGKLSQTPAASPIPPASLTPPSAASGTPPVMPPSPPPMDFSRPAAPPVSAPVEPQQPGEFTQLFQRISPAGGAAQMTPPFGAIPSTPVPEISRPIDPIPRADFAAPPPPAPSLPQPPGLSAPSLGAAAAAAFSLGSLGAATPTPGPLPPAPRFDSPPAPNVNALNTPPSPSLAPPAPAWGAAPAAPAAAASLFSSGGGQSEFTRILGRVAVPPPPPISIQPPAPNAAPASAPNAQGSSKSVLPLVIALGVLMLVTLAIVGYFIFRK